MQPIVEEIDAYGQVKLCLIRQKDANKHTYEDSGCGSVGRAVASNARGPRFISSHQQKFIFNIRYLLYWKDENKEKEAGNGRFF